MSRAMTDGSRLSTICISFGACIALFPIADLSGQEGNPGLPVDRIRFEKGKGNFAPERYSYAGGKFKTSYHGDGSCSVNGVDFLASKYHYTFSTGGRFQTGDLVGLLGGVFRADCFDADAVLERIPDDKLPKGAKVPKWDSLTVPLPGTTGFNKGIYVKVLDIDAKGEKGSTASLQIVLTLRDKPPKDWTTLTATVKQADILLLRDNLRQCDNGHLVRAIVPPDRKTRVVGWIELSPEPIPEADLIRDKKAFVRPTPKDEKN